MIKVQLRLFSVVLSHDSERSTCYCHKLLAKSHSHLHSRVVTVGHPCLLRRARSARLSTFCPVVSAHGSPGTSPLHLRSALFMAQGSSNTSTFSNALNSSAGRPRHLRDSVPVLSFSQDHAPPQSVFGTFGPKMAVATFKVRHIDPLRRPSVSARRSAVQMSPLLPPFGVPNLVGVVCTP
ncbi:hypothetical protein NDU88_007270 [Pleurodeles waltl]|uniref:Uncharacterized protein n=1 Tax=Pleurodeles waltl TaxID=8319 RepID=A0AAV7WH63_PLEWA|nr:hypothetical protein NDU88_007270 [Pleurodeles waltl]